MKYFIDTEFYESKKPVKVLGITIKEIWTIELISIGIVCEDGREYYAISEDFNIREAWKDKWIRDNVLKPIYEGLLQQDGLSVKESKTACFTLDMFKFFIRKYGKSNKQIAEEIKEFTLYKNVIFEGKKFKVDSIEKNHVNISWDNELGRTLQNGVFKWDNPEFYGYYADYDWVVFCWLFGRMIDLPRGFPMYCKDLKQMMDDKGLNEKWKNLTCPDPEGEHNALIDAKWNKKLYNKIIQLS